MKPGDFSGRACTRLASAATGALDAGGRSLRQAQSAAADTQLASTRCRCRAMTAGVTAPSMQGGQRLFDRRTAPS